MHGSIHPLLTAHDPRSRTLHLTRVITIPLLPALSLYLGTFVSTYAHIRLFLSTFPFLRSMSVSRPPRSFFCPLSSSSPLWPTLTSPFVTVTLLHQVPCIRAPPSPPLLLSPFATESGRLCVPRLGKLLSTSDLSLRRFLLPRLSALLPLASSRYPLPRRPRTIISAIYSRLVVGPPLCVFGACIADRRLGCGMSCWRHDRVVQATMCIIY